MPKSIDPHPVAAEIPKTLAADTPMPAAQSSTLPSTKEIAEKVAEPEESLNEMAITEIKPALLLSQAPVAPMDAMEIEQPANPPDNTPPDEPNHQVSTHSGQEKIDAMARHRTALKEIWAKRVL